MNKNKKLNIFMSILALTSISVNPVLVSYAQNSDLFNKNNQSKSTVASERYTVNWLKNVGSEKEDKFYKTIPTKDKGYIAVGQASLSETIGFTTGDAIIVKYDDKGQETWRDILQGDETDRYYSVVELNDGKFVAFGISYSTNLDFDNANRKGYAIAVLYNSDGAREKVLGYNDGSKTLAYRDAILLSDGHVLAVCGEIKANIGGSAIEKDDIIVGGLHKIDFTSSEKMQRKNIELFNLNNKNNVKTVISDIITTSDNNILATGYEYIEGDDNAKTQFVIKMDEKGEEIWSTLDDSLSLMSGYSIVESKDGFIYVAGEIGSVSNNEKDAILLKFNKDKGQPIWSIVLDGENYDSFNSVSVDDNGDIIVVGHSNSRLENTTISNDKKEIVVAKFEKNQGNMLDIINLGTDTQGIVAYSSFQNSDGDLIIAGKQGFSIDNACDLINPCTQFDAVLLSVTADLKKSSDNTNPCVATPIKLKQDTVTIKLDDKINILDYIENNEKIDIDDIEIITELSKDEDNKYFSKVSGTYETTIKIKDNCDDTQVLKLKVIVVDPNCSIQPPIINGKDEHTYYIGDTFEALKLITFSGINADKVKNTDTSTTDGVSTLTTEYESGDKIIIISNVDFQKEGTYSVKYILTNKCGEATKEIKVNVKNKNNNTGNTNKPQTGDNTLLYVLLFGVSIGSLILLNIRNNNSDDEKKDK